MKKPKSQNPLLAATLAILLMFNLHCFSQNCGASSNAYGNKYSQQSFYVPTVNDPVVTVKLTFHIFNNTAGTSNNYQPTGSSYNDIITIKNLVSNPVGYARMSEKRAATYSVIDPSTSLPFEPPFNANYGPNLMDSRVNYEVTNVYFYNSDALYNGTDYDLINYLYANYPDRLNEGLPIMFNPYPLSQSGTGLAGYIAPLGNPTNGYYRCVNTAVIPTNGTWSVFEHLRHEVGHCMGWEHTYSAGGSCELWNNSCGTADFLSDVFPLGGGAVTCPSGSNPYSCNTCSETNPNYTSNNVMAGSNNTWMSPLQMGRRMRNLHLNNRNLQRFVKESVSQSSSFFTGVPGKWDITSDETWDFDIQMYDDIVVESGNTLTIKCKVAMAADGKIIVKQGAKLVIDGGTVTGWCKKAPPGNNTSWFAGTNMPSCWYGILALSDPTTLQAINTSGYAPHHGIVEIKNQGTISNAIYGVIGLNSNTTAYNYFFAGGIIIADHANFINNNCDIALGKCQVGFTKSKVTNCKFSTTAEIGWYPDNSLVTPDAHIRLINNNGFVAKGCVFEYLGTTYPNNEGTGIIANNSNFTVDQQGTTRSEFNDLKLGVWINNYNPISVGTIQNSDFSDNVEHAILAENANYLHCMNNNFQLTGFQPGIYLHKCKYYTIANNTINSVAGQGIGIAINDSKLGAHQIYRNNITDCYAGILCMNDNGGYSMGTSGLKMNCNVFNQNGDNNFYDIALTYDQTTPIVMTEQSSNTASSGFDFVRNVYSAPYVGATSYNKWFVDPSNIQNIIHSCSPGSIDNPNNPHVQASPQVWVAPYNYSFAYGTHCPAITSSAPNPVQLASTNLSGLNRYVNELAANPQDNNFELQTTVASKLNIFLTDSISASQDSVEAILSSNQGNMDDADIQLIFAKISSGKYSDAANLISSLANKTDWQNILTKISETDQDPLGVKSLASNITRSDFFINAAASNGKDGQSCAQTVLKLAYGTDHTYPLVYPPSLEGARTSNQVGTTGINATLLNNSNFKLYPNPANNSVNIVCPSTVNGPVKVSITDVLGKTVLTEQINFSEKNFTTTVLLDKLRNGVYLLSLIKEDNEIIYQSKLVKQN